MGSLDVAQGRMCEAPSEKRTHYSGFISLAGQAS